MFDKIKNTVSPSKDPLQKAKIVYEGGTGVSSLECQFNPVSLTINKTVSWKPVAPAKERVKAQPDQNAPRLVFGGGGSATFNLDLIFDTTLIDNQDVRGYTNQLLKLTLKGAGDPAKRKLNPPKVQFVWGQFLLFRAYITSVQINYTLFLPSGLPVRARANVGFVQCFDEDGPLAPQNPTSRTDPRKIHLVEQGERLDFLAFKEYGNAELWREIAEANGLDNPFDLRTGQTLVLPDRS